MACGGEAATKALRVVAAGRVGGAITGTGTVVYSAISTATGTLSVAAWSLCCPCLQCSAQRLVDDGSIAPVMSSQWTIGVLASALTASALRRSRACAGARPGHA